MKRNRCKIIFVISFLILFKENLVSAQAFKEGDNALSIGYGFGVLDHDNDNIFDTEVISNPLGIGPIYLKYQSALTRKMSLGINLNYSFYKTAGIYTNGGSLTPSPPFNYVPVYYKETWYYAAYSALARINWHFGDNGRFDPYAGIGLGCRGEYTKNTSTDSSNASQSNTYNNIYVCLEATIGARYYLNDDLALYAETGFSQSIVQLGLTYKLR